MATYPDVPATSANGWTAGTAQAASGPDVGQILQQMTGEIQARLAEVEHRHAAAMQEMQAKLERMSGEANRARPEMPSQLANAFSRIEAGMADLVDRIAETVPERRKGAEAFVFAAHNGDHSHFVFNPPPRVPIAPVSANPPAVDGWDQESAEALARLYESGDALLAKPLPEEALFAPAQWSRNAAAGQSVVPGIADNAPQAGAQPIPAVHDTAPLSMAAEAGQDRAWLDERFAAISDRISESMRSAGAAGAMDTLMARVDQLEARFTSALDGVAKAGPDALAHVELQIHDLASQLEHTQSQLSRLDQIEQHLADLTAVAQASLEPAATEGHHEAAAASHDFVQLADLAVERALARAPASVSAPESDAKINAMEAMIAELTSGRERSEQHTAGMLETIQEALIRLIDRLDAIDAGMNSHLPAAAAAAPAAAVYAAPANFAAPPMAPAPEPIAAPAAKPAPYLQPETPSAASPASTVEEPPARLPRRRERRGIAFEMPPVAAAADAASAAAIEQKRQEINIKDLRLSVGAAATSPAAAEAVADEPAATPRPRQGRAPIQAASGAAGKRGIAVAAAALSLVGVSYVANLMFADRFNSHPSPVAAAGAPSVVGPATPAAAAAPINGPPGMVGAPVRADAPKAMPQAQPASTTMPVAPEAVPVAAPVAAPTALPVNVVPKAAPPAAPVIEPSAPGRPQTVPETGTDDLSDADINVQGPAVKPGRPVPVAATIARDPGAAAIAPASIPGLSLAPPSRPVQPSDLAYARQQANIAAASERLSDHARTVTMPGTPRTVGSLPSPRPVAQPASATSPISTGTVTTPAPRSDEGPVTTSGTAVEMPPATVGPLSLRIAAQKGDPSAAFEVATRFAEGRGIKQDFAQAMIWYQRAAAKGFAVAEYRLGTLYERGLGVAADPARAKEWYQRAAERGNVKAMHNLAVICAGSTNSAPDYKTAAKWFAAAAERGLTDSQFNLGVLNENGLGIAKDPSQAYIWYALAARNGDPEATRRRDKLSAALDVTALQVADEKIRNWHARASSVQANDARVAGDLWRNNMAQAGIPPAAPQLQ